MLSFFRRSLRTILSAAIGLVAAFAAVVTGLVAYNQARQSIETEAKEKLVALGQAAEGHVVSVLTMRRWQIEQVASGMGLAALTADDPATYRGALQAMAEASHLASLAVVDGKGTIVVASNSADIGKSLAGEPWFRGALSEARYGEMRPGADELGEFRVTVPVVDDRTNRSLGVVVGYAQAARIYAFLTDTKGRGRTGESYLIDREGMLLTPSRFIDDAEFKIRNQGGAHEQFAKRREEAVGGWPDYRGEPVLGAVNFNQIEEVGGPSWAVVTEIDEAEAFASALTLRTYVLTITTGMILAALVVGYWIARAITTPVQALAAAAERIGRGDLTAQIDESDRVDEIGLLQRTFAQMVLGLRAMVANLREGVGSLTANTAQISATAKESSAAAAEQASTVAEVTTTVEEVGQTSKAAAERAQEVLAAAEEAAERGQRGVEAVDSSVELMQAITERVERVAAKILELSERNAKIGEIVETVNDLAEQSNLLAVNASIEAAKAGEQGRGFAVVASEVRTLAEQSKRATTQIRELLADIQKSTESAVMATEESTKRVEDGRRAVEDVSATIRELVATVETNADKARQIAASATQQASGISQISSAMESVAQAGRDNAAGAKQLEDAVVQLAALSRQLDGLAKQYTV